jgi:VanZ family protein
MSSSSRAARYWISAWLPVALGIAIIVAESTAYFGADHTSGPLRWLFQLLFGPVSDAHWDFLHHIIRKSGHFLGYGAIGLAWLRAWRMTLTAAPFHTDAALALLGTAMLASWDEWHQGFLPNRTSSPWDVLLDCCGALVMLSFAWMLRRNSWRNSPPQPRRLVPRRSVD